MSDNNEYSNIHFGNNIIIVIRFKVYRAITYMNIISYSGKLICNALLELNVYFILTNYDVIHIIMISVMTDLPISRKVR